MNVFRPTRCFVAAALIAVLCATGCGFMTDKGRIRVAKVGEDYITRDDLARIIREMPAEERPQIRTKGDLLVALNDIIDEKIKQAQAEALRDQGKIRVQREEAEVAYIMRYPEKFQEFLQLEAVLPEDDIQSYREEREIGIDREEERLYGDRALSYLIADTVQRGALSVTDEQYEEQYELRKGQLYTFEQVVIDGVYLPKDAEYEVDVYAEATEVKERIEAGEDPEVIAKEYAEQNGGQLKVGLENKMVDPKFAMFWQQASQSEEGDVVTAFIPGWQRNRTNPDGTQETVPIPDSQLVCRIERYVPARQKTLEEAKPQLEASILFAKMMEQLREQSGVEVYENKLPDPGIYDAASPASIFEQ
jgi:hypothetical protein